MLAKSTRPLRRVRPAEVAVSSFNLRLPIGERQPSSVANASIEQLANRLAILGHHKELIAEGIRRCVKRDSVLRTSTLEKTLLGPFDGPQLRLEVSSKINEAQVQVRDAATSLPRTIRHIPSIQQ